MPAPLEDAMRRLVPVVALLAGCTDNVYIKPLDTDVPVPIDTDPGLAIGQPDIEVTPTEIRFPALPLECATDPRTVTITNVGDADLVLDSVELKGAGVGAFSLDRPNNPVIPPGASRTVELGFLAHQFVEYDPKLVIESNDPDEPTVRVSLWGAGSQAAYLEDLFVQESAAGVDVLWLVDNSGSMSEELNRLGRSFDAFISTFVNLGLDYHVVVAASSDESDACRKFRGPVITPAMSQADAIAEFDAQATLQSGCGEESGFDGARGALGDPDNLATGFLRPNATLAVIAVSDEEEQASDGIRPADFATWLASLKGGDASKVSFSALTGPATGTVFGCPLFSGSDAEPAPRYHAAIRATGGVWGDLCHFDVRPFLANVSYVAAGLEYRFPLTDTPEPTTGITVTVDGVAVPYGITDGWTYDPDSNSVELHGASIPDPGAAIVVRYPYDPGC
jgi:hypothetical protein